MAYLIVSVLCTATNVLNRLLQTAAAITTSTHAVIILRSGSVGMPEILSFSVHVCKCRWLVCVFCLERQHSHALFW